MLQIPLIRKRMWLVFVNHNPTLYLVYLCSVLCLFSGHMCRRCTPVLPILAFPTRDPTHSSDATQLLAMPVLLHHSRSYNTTIRLSVFRHRSSLFPKSHTTRLVKKKRLNSNIHSATMLLLYFTAKGVVDWCSLMCKSFFCCCWNVFFAGARSRDTWGALRSPACARYYLPRRRRIWPRCVKKHMTNVERINHGTRRPRYKNASGFISNVMSD